MFPRTYLAGLLLIAGTALQAQQIKLEQLKNWKPRNIGPAGMSGRITAIDALVDNPNTIYLGAASGGVWRTDNAGNSWTPLFDDQPILNIGSIAIQQSNPSIVWVGTGEGNPRNSLNLGEGIFKTQDGGKTWKRMGLEKTRNIHRILIDPNNPNMVYAGAIGNPYRGTCRAGRFQNHRRRRYLAKDIIYQRYSRHRRHGHGPFKSQQNIRGHVATSPHSHGVS